MKTETTINIEWMEPRQWLVPIKDAIEIYYLYERALLQEEDERRKYLRGELSVLCNKKTYQKSEDRIYKLQTILTKQARYVDDLIQVMNELRLDENALVVDYLMDEDITQQQLADRYGLDVKEVVSQLRAVRYALDGRDGYTTINSGSVALIRRFIAAHGVI